MRRLKHKNIIQIEEVHETENSVYIVMEHLKGEPIIKNSKNLPQTMDEIKTIMQALLEGIQYLDQNEIVHKDLKPYNILFKDQNDPSSLKILDFGLAAEYNDKKRLFRVAGTPGFFAPEIFKSTRDKDEISLGSKMDVFAAGVIFYYYLFRKSIFKGASTKEIYQKNKLCNINLNQNCCLEKKFEARVAYNLLKIMLEEDPKERCTVSEALNHEFFNEKEKESDDIPEEPVSQAIAYLNLEFKHPALLSHLEKKFGLGNGKRRVTEV